MYFKRVHSHHYVPSLDLLTTDYYLEDSSIAVREPKILNSGQPMGTFLNRAQHRGNDGELFHPTDFMVGEEVDLFHRRFRIIDCDKHTRDHFFAACTYFRFCHSPMLPALLSLSVRSTPNLTSPSHRCFAHKTWVGPERVCACVRFTSHLYFSRSLFSCCLALLLHRTCLPVRTFRLSFTTTDDIEMPLSESFPYDPHMDECKIIAPHQDKRS